MFQINHVMESDSGVLVDQVTPGYYATEAVALSVASSLAQASRWAATLSDAGLDNVSPVTLQTTPEDTGPRWTFWVAQSMSEMVTFRWYAVEAETVPQST
jgi:hypothetical protein